MLTKFLKWAFDSVKPSTMLQDAENKILNQKMITSHSLNKIDVVNNSMFFCGVVKAHGLNLSFDGFRVIFGHKDQDVAIKYEDEVIYYFSDAEDVKVIRDAIAKCYDNIREREKKIAYDKFKQL